MLEQDKFQMWLHYSGLSEEVAASTIAMFYDVHILTILQNKLSLEYDWILNIGTQSINFPKALKNLWISFCD